MPLPLPIPTQAATLTATSVATNATNNFFIGASPKSYQRTVQLYIEPLLRNSAQKPHSAKFQDQTSKLARVCQAGGVAACMRARRLIRAAELLASDRAKRNINAAPSHSSVCRALETASQERYIHRRQRWRPPALKAKPSLSGYVIQPAIILPFAHAVWITSSEDDRQFV